MVVEPRDQIKQNSLLMFGEFNDSNLLELNDTNLLSSFRSNEKKEEKPEINKLS